MQDLEQDITANNWVKKKGRYAGLKDSVKRSKKETKWGGFGEQQEKIIRLEQVVQAGKWGE